MLRNISGSFPALLTAVLAVRNPFRVRYGGRPGSRIRVDGLVTGAGVTPDRTDLLGSLPLPAAFAAPLSRTGATCAAAGAVA
ncbi:hypothetical protein [Streptomyces sp. NPDC020983]|uniref:hypothetical protein n=1 Tax=Streptomyces sp. NPDC020983 TaxID=3365106 RepID=UPI0037984BB4